MPQFIVIGGIDGCGKTTVIERLRRRLEQEGLTTGYEWMRYNHRLVRPVHAFSRLVGLSRRYEVEGQSIWRHEFHRSRSFASFYVVLTWLDAWLGRLLLATRLSFQGVDIVVCDRWVQDILVDLVVDTRRRSLLGGRWHARFSRILPRGARQYLIMRDPDAIVSARPDVRRDLSGSFRQRLYRRLARNPDVVVIRNDGTVDDAVEAILRDWKCRTECTPDRSGLRPVRSGV